MAKSVKKGTLSKRNKWIIGVVAVLVFLVVFVMVFGTPGAESVFNDMNDKMLQTKSVTVEQKMDVTSSDGSIASIESTFYTDMNSNSQLLAKGNFSLNMVNGQSPMSVGGDLIKIGDSEYVKYTGLSSSSASLASSFSSIEAKLKGNWIKVRASDQFASLAQGVLKSTSSVLPIPVANLSNAERKDALAILRDKDMYTIDESSKVETAGVTAYKYSIKYDKTLYEKVEKLISKDVGYFKVSDSADSKISSMTVWVNINTRQLVKVEFTGTSSEGSVEGTISYSGYGQVKKVDKPSDYFIESELMN